MNGNKTTSANSTHGGGEYKSLDLFEILDTDEWETQVEYGGNYLSIQDLLSILISDGDKKKAEKAINNLLEAFGHDLIEVLTASIYQLVLVEGIETKEACKIKIQSEEKYCVLWERSKIFLGVKEISCRGERMRKIVVLLLVVGLIIGTFTAVLSESEENPGQDMLPFGGEDFEDPLGDPLPCGGEGGGAAVPG